MRDFLESREFYELMQAYRHEPYGAAECVICFEAVKMYIRANMPRRTAHKARRTDPKTSHDAARAPHGKKISAYLGVARSLGAQGVGFTSHELADALGDSYDVGATVTTKLLDAGFLYRTGETRMGPKGHRRLLNFLVEM